MKSDVSNQGRGFDLRFDTSTFLIFMIYVITFMKWSSGMKILLDNLLIELEKAIKNNRKMNYER